MIVDYLERKGTECDDARQRPAIDDVQETNIVQIVPCPVQGEWDLSS